MRTSNEGGPEDAVQLDADDVLGDGGLGVSHEVLELDHVSEGLDQSRRRYLCRALLEDDEWSLSVLARTVAAWEEGVPRTR